MIVQQPCNIIIFGGSGDLTYKKLIPALFDLFSASSCRSIFSYSRCRAHGIFRRGHRERAGGFAQSRRTDPFSLR